MTNSLKQINPKLFPKLIGVPFCTLLPSLFPKHATNHFSILMSQLLFILSLAIVFKEIIKEDLEILDHGGGSVRFGEDNIPPNTLQRTYNTACGRNILHF